MRILKHILQQQASLSQAGQRECRVENEVAAALGKKVQVRIA